MKNALTNEEVLEMIKNGELDIKQLAQIAQTISQAPVNNTSKTIIKKDPAPVTKPTYELTVCNYPDISITRTSAQTVKQLVLMVSQDQYYITNLVNGKRADVTQLTSETYAKFTSGMPDIELPEDFWAEKISSGKTFYEAMIKYLHTFATSPYKQTMLNMIKDRCAPKFKIPSHSWEDPYSAALNVYCKSPILYKEYYNNETVLWFMRWQIDCICDMVNHFGLNNVRDYFDSIAVSLIDVKSMESHNFYHYIDGHYTFSFIPGGIDCNYAAFKEYTLYKSVRFGFGKSLRNFFRQWHDDIDMQQKLYGKIKDKYPDNLPTHHNQLSYQLELHREEIDAKNFERNVQKAKAFEWKMDKDEGRFVFLAPTEPEDFYDEATQQANCLAGYVRRFTEGDDIIMFMRDKETPEVSEVTIEIVDRTITQAYQAHNAKITEEQREAITKWTKKFNLMFH